MHPSDRWGEESGKKERRKNNIFISNTDRGGGGGKESSLGYLRDTQKIPTVARNSTKNRRFAKSDLIEWLLSPAGCGWSWLCSLGVTLSPGAPPWLIKHTGSGPSGRTEAWGTQFSSPWPQPECSRGPETVTGGLPGRQQGQMDISRGGRTLILLISECLFGD